MKNTSSIFHLLIPSTPLFLILSFFHSFILSFLPMKCLILAAGYATRLYPLTENFPKPLLKVGDKTILDWLIDDIDGAGLVDEYVVISNHKFAHHFMDWAATKAQKVTVVDDGTSSNETRLGAVRDIQYAIDSLSLDDDMLVIAGDNLLDFSLQRFVRYANEKQTSCIMRFWEVRRSDCGPERPYPSHDREVPHARNPLVYATFLFLYTPGRTPRRQRHLGGLRHRRSRQLHRMALPADTRPRYGDAGAPFRHRQPAELRAGSKGLSGHHHSLKVLAGTNTCLSLKNSGFYAIFLHIYLHVSRK